MTTRDDLIYNALASHIGACDLGTTRCYTHDSTTDADGTCAAMNDALDMTGEAVNAVVADLLRQAKELDIVEPEYPAIHDAVDRDEVLRLLGGAR